MPLEKLRVLMVDDDEDYAESVRLVVEKGGYAFHHAEDREEGLRRVESARPDVILLDVVMGDRTEGFLFAHQLRSGARAQRFSEIPIIVLTGMHGRPEPIEHAVSPDQPIFGPGDEFLEKPVKPRALLDALARALNPVNRPC